MHVKTTYLAYMRNNLAVKDFDFASEAAILIETAYLLFSDIRN